MKRTGLNRDARSDKGSGGMSRWRGAIEKEWRRFTQTPHIHESSEAHQERIKTARRGKMAARSLPPSPRYALAYTRLSSPTPPETRAIRENCIHAVQCLRLQNISARARKITLYTDESSTTIPQSERTTRDRCRYIPLCRIDQSVESLFISKIAPDLLDLRPNENGFWGWGWSNFFARCTCSVY